MMKNTMMTLILLSMISINVQAADDSVRDAYARSFQYEQNQNYDDGIRALMPLFNSAPKSYSLNLRIGWLHYLSGRYSNSIEHYKKAMKAEPHAIEPILGLLLPLLAQQRYSEAEHNANKILRKDSNNYYGNLRRVVALRLQDKLDFAQRAVQKMRQLYPADIIFLEQEAIIKVQLKEFENASQLYAELLVLDPENLSAKGYFGVN